MVGGTIGTEVLLSRARIAELEAEVSRLTQERDANDEGWLQAESELALEGALHQVTKDRLAALTEALEGLEREMRRLSDRSAHDAPIVSMAIDSWADRLAALRTP